MNAEPQASEPQTDKAELELAGDAAVATRESNSTLYRPDGESLVNRVSRQTGVAIREAGYGTSLYALRLQGPHPMQLKASPDDPAPGNAAIGHAMLGGDLNYGPESLDLTAAPWSALWHKSHTFFKYGQSFAWLRHLAQVGDQRAAREVAEMLARQWMDRFESWDRDVWAPALIGSRLSNWIVHAPLLLSSSDMVYRSKVLACMSYQARHLNNTISDASPGLDQVRAATGLLFAGLLLPTGANWRVKGEKWLEKALADTVLRDGGPVGRNPAHAIKVLRLLILVRSAYADMELEIPQEFLFAVDRLAPFVRMMRLGGGLLGQFNGAVAEGGFGTDAILSASGSTGKASSSAPYAGFQRIEHGRSIMVMDSGCPPAGDRSAASHAGTLSFEISDGDDRLVVNMGRAVDAGPLADLAGLARTTAAHSTLVLNDTNSSSMQDDGTLGPGVERVRVRRGSKDGGTWLEADHDGYIKRFGFLHRRRITVDASGYIVAGKDQLKPGGKRQKPSNATIRFHLHPGVSAEVGPSGDEILLRTTSGNVWLFSTDQDVEMEESLYMTRPDHPERARQLVINVPRISDRGIEVNWSFTKQPQT